MAMPTPKGWLFCIALIALPLSGWGEIYKWVDAKGQVHFSDKRYADDRAKRIDDEPLLAQQGGNQFTFQPEADAMLRQNQNQPLGLSTALSAGNWGQNGTRYQNVSVMRFEIGPLLEEMHRNPQKKLLRATLQLHANTDDKPYGQGVNSQEPAGHSSKGGDNAFYLKPVHNNFEEVAVTWSSFFDQSNYTPSAIRSLPGIAVPGSGEDPRKNYEIDVLPLVQKLMEINLRQITLEMRLQRSSGRAQVTFFSREAEVGKRPTLQVELFNPDPG
jgi:hypothetical protein